MAKVAKESIVDGLNLMECPMCMDKGQQKTLICGHSLCEDCERKLPHRGRHRNEITCPFCTMTTMMPPVESTMYPVRVFHLAEVLALTQHCLPKKKDVQQKSLPLPPAAAPTVASLPFAQQHQQPSTSPIVRGPSKQQPTEAPVIDPIDLRIWKAAKKLRPERDFGPPMTAQLRSCTAPIARPPPPDFDDLDMRIADAALKVALRRSVAVFDEDLANRWRPSLPDAEMLLKKYDERQFKNTIDPKLIRRVANYLIDSTLDGEMLVFLPGFDDISRLAKEIMDDWKERKKRPDHTGPQPVIVEVLGGDTIDDNVKQLLNMELAPGDRKVILATNIAEASSVALKDVVFVVDCGKVKQKQYDHVTGVWQLQTTEIAQSDAKQRQDCAGRCRPGYCFRLYSVGTYEQMLLAPMAEMHNYRN